MPSIHDVINKTFNSKVVQVEYDDDNNIIYSGVHDTKGATDTSSGWEIKRFWYENGNLIKMERQFGVWSKRASLEW